MEPERGKRQRDQSEFAAFSQELSETFRGEATSHVFETWVINVNACASDLVGEYLVQYGRALDNALLFNLPLPLLREWQDLEQLYPVLDGDERLEEIRRWHAAAQRKYLNAMHEAISTRFEKPPYPPGSVESNLLGEIAPMPEGVRLERYLDAKERFFLVREAALKRRWLFDVLCEERETPFDQARLRSFR